MDAKLSDGAKRSIRHPMLRDGVFRRTESYSMPARLMSRTSCRSQTNLPLHQKSSADQQWCALLAATALVT
jgi:hypothetical protein